MNGFAVERARRTEETLSLVRQFPGAESRFIADRLKVHARSALRYLFDLERRGL